MTATATDPRTREQLLADINRLETENARLRNLAPPFRTGAPHNGTDTSIRAAQHVAPKAGAMRQTILDLYTQRGPLMCGQVEQLTGWQHQSVSARIRELVLEGALEDTGRRAVWEGSGRTQRIYDLPAKETLF